MAWVQWQIEHKGKTMSGWVDQEQLIFDVPFELNIKVNDIFSVNDNKIKAISVENVGNRNENLIIKGELDGKSTKGGASDKTGERTSKSKTND
jgi:hypothetical protein